MSKKIALGILIVVIISAILTACQPQEPPEPQVEPPAISIALIPIDARPVSREMVVEIGAVGGVEILVPPMEIMGFRRQPADLVAIRQWLDSVAEQVDVAILSIDLLGYGGLSPSRQSEPTYDEVRANLEPILMLREAHPTLPIYAFSTTMRIPAHNTGAEEPEYWAHHGYNLWRYSFYDDMYRITGDASAQAEAQLAKTVVPAEYVEDFHARRQRNFSINMYALELVEQGIIDLIIFPQDDTSEYGFNIAEQRQLRAEINQRGLGMKALIYPGTDEVAAVLSASAINHMTNTTPKFYPFYSSVRGPLIHARYEDRPLGETVKSQIFAVGGMMVDNASEADIILAVNTPGNAQGESPNPGDRRIVDTAGRNLPEFVGNISRYLEEGRSVAVADLAYANGADDALVLLMGNNLPLYQLDGYAGWNTAGNSMGTVAAHASMRHWAKTHQSLGNSQQQAHHSFLFKRFADDYLYQFKVRTQVQRQYGYDRLPPAQLEEVTVELMEPALVDFYERYFRPAGELRLRRIYLPWGRSFEIGLDLSLE